MKKRILALIMAAILTASMAACQSSAGDLNEGGGNNQGTEGKQERPDEPTPDEGNTSTTVTWTEVNDTVYTTKEVIAISVTDAKSSKISAATKLTRLKIGSNKKSIVVKDGVQYYVDTASLTTSDLLGETLTACDPVTMYVKKKTAVIYKYASDTSATIVTKKLNDPLTVVAKSSAWVKIQYDENNQYFIKASDVSDKETLDPNDIKNYPTFSTLAPADRFDLFVVADSLTLRLCPSTDAEGVEYLVKGDKLLVLGEATVDDTVWYYVAFAVEGKDGQGSDNLFGYVANSKYVSTDSSASATITLADVLKDYPEFTALAVPQIMYVSATSLNTRLTPEILEDNLAFISLKKADSVKVVATGSKNDIFWGIIEEEGKFYFVSYTYLTTDSTGKPAPMSLDQLLNANPEFTKLETPKTVYAKGNVNCNTVPEYQSEVEKKLSAGQAVTVVAEGEIRLNTWYIFKTSDGEYFFAGADLFTEAQA